LRQINHSQRCCCLFKFPGMWRWTIGWMVPALEDEETIILRYAGNQWYSSTASHARRLEFSVQTTFYNTCTQKKSE